MTVAKIVKRPSRARRSRTLQIAAFGLSLPPLVERNNLRRGHGGPCLAPRSELAHDDGHALGQSPQLASLGPAHGLSHRPYAVCKCGFDGVFFKRGGTRRRTRRQMVRRFSFVVFVARNVAKILGRRRRARIKSPQLYRLSYRPDLVTVVSLRSRPFDPA